MSRWPGRSLEECPFKNLNSEVATACTMQNELLRSLTIWF